MTAAAICPAASAPIAAAVIFRLPPVVKTWLRRCSDASRCLTVKTAASCGPSASPAILDVVASFFGRHSHP